MTRHRSLREKSEWRPNKRLGQHFLKDRLVSEKIISLSGFGPSDQVLEIGPGRGALTLPLSRTVSSVVAVEKDARLADLLQEKLDRANICNVTLICRDILTFDFSMLHRPPLSRMQVVGNLPYNISSPVLEKLVANRHYLSRAVLMFQREVARRLTAAPDTRDYGALTLLVRYHARAASLLKVSRNVFYPMPKVDSMVVELDFERPYPSQGVSEELFRKTVKGAFAHRRKTLFNSLKGYFPDWTSEALLNSITDCGIDPKRRAETLSMDEFLALAANLGVDKR